MQHLVASVPVLTLPGAWPLALPSHPPSAYSPQRLTISTGSALCSHTQVANEGWISLYRGVTAPLLGNMVLLGIHCEYPSTVSAPSFYPCCLAHTSTIPH